MNNAVVGLLALGGIVYYMFYKKNRNKDAGAKADELKSEDEKVVTKTVRADDDI